VDGSIGRLLRFAGVTGFAIALATTTGCDGKLIHLGDGRADGGAPCAHAQVKASEVVWIGDSWILVTGTQHTHVRDLARAAGAIGPGDDYVIAAVAASTMSAIAGQYDTQEAGATKVKVVIMDGGTWDTIQGMGSTTSVNEAASAFAQFLAKVASDGTVQHVVYFLPPELTAIPGVAALRPLVQQACAQSTVPCHFLDLQQPPFGGHAEYTSGFLPTESGSMALGDEIWAAMQQSCIAQ
jgi:hypothetical protein